ncbi:16S rRNA (cytosine(967)-C(5))-methyltransferase RsmB [Proteocatella sphenisci]|uniref:16S rRNA (cytosine(967)-C(5))-methyltransferase RsmB n=1 Tax=Proteocatella sphenisci TaxID=181070 RepID=UPI00048AA24E|nr:16S rRNA (cytosine(967)-C(5))-methyltransferase RsmB [Proteocatella sphenisci]
MKNPRELGYEAIYNVINQGGYSNITINKILRKNELDNINRGFFTELVYGTIENKLYLDYVIQKFSKQKISDISREVLVILEMGLYQIREMNSVTDFAAVDESVKLCKKVFPRGSGFVNAVLRNVLRDPGAFDIDIKNTSERVSVEYSVSPDIVDLLMKQYDLEGTEDIMYGFSIKPKLYIRANSLRTSPQKLAELLKEEGADAQLVEEVKGALVVKNLKNIENSKSYKDGLFSVQDISSMRCVKELDPAAGEYILDICACPGGKTGYIAELMNNEGRIDAMDISQNKLELVTNTCKRLGVKIVNTSQNDATIYNPDMAGKYDRVLVDAPCSGIGIIRRKPEIRYKTIKDISSIYNIQRKIIQNASKYIKIGGIMIYSTCTINKEENQDITDDFLKKNGNFEKTQEDVMMLPSDGESDGFYICKLKRIS